MAIKRPALLWPPAAARGMALLVVLLILAVMVIVASNMSGRLQLELRRTANLTLGKQAWWYAMSAEALVIKVLNQDFKDDPDRVSLGQNWAREDRVFPVEDGTLGPGAGSAILLQPQQPERAPQEGRTATISRPSLTSSRCSGPCSPSSRWMITKRCS